jgi:hypothetical protein
MTGPATHGTRATHATARRPPGQAKQAARRSARVGDAHERQADQRSAQFLAGAHGLGRGLISAPAASVHLPGSRPEQLPTGLQAALEQAFAADLSAVRVHHDAAAQRAAASLGATAFAGGASMYFAGGAYAPGSRAGQALIAHELTHVLQQTGRAASGGGLRVDAVRGASGAVQCQWASPLASTTVEGTAADLMSGHLDALDASTVEHAVIARLERESAAANTGGAAYWALRANYVMAEAADPVLGGSPLTVAAPIASAVYDGLKLSGLTVAAAKLLHRRPDLETLFFSAATYERYVDDHGSDFSIVKRRLYAHWVGGGWFGNGTPRFMLDRSLVFLLGPSTVNSWQTVRDGDLVDLANAELLRRHAGTLVPDELYYVTVLVAAQIEQLRHAMLDGARDDVTTMHGYDPNDRVGLKRTTALRLRERCDEAVANRNQVLTGMAEGTLSLPFARETMLVWLDDEVPALRNMAQYALDFWNLHEPFDASLRSGEAITGLSGTAAAQLADIDTTVPGYRDALDAFLHAVIDRNADGSLPEPAAFAARRDAAVRALDQEMFRTVERPLADSLMAALPSSTASTAATQGFDFSAARANAALAALPRSLRAWLLTVANALRRQALNSYASAADTAQIARQRGVQADAPATDLRDLFRVRLAETALDVARRAGWDAWVEWVRPVVWGLESDAAGNDIGGDYVAFGTDWQLDAETPVSRMRDDLPAVAHGFEPLRTADLVEFYLATEYDAMTRHIDTMLDANRGVYTLGAEPLINQAFTAARAEFRAQRYVIRDWEWVTPWTDTNGTRERSPRTDLRLLLSAHPLTRALTRDVGARYTHPVAWAVNAAPVDGRSAVVLWVMPTPVELIGRLQAIREVNLVLLEALPELVAELPALLGADSTLPPADQQALRDLVADVEAGRGYRSDAAPAPAAPLLLQQLTLDMLTSLRWDIWWDLWRAILAVHAGFRRGWLLADLRQALADAGLSAELHSEREAAFDTLQAAQRSALAHERRRVVETQLRPTLSNFDAHSWDRYRIPGRQVRVERLLAQEAADLLERFVNNLPDLTEREGHLAMAVLELADPLHDKLAEHRELNDIIAWVPLIDSALYWVGLAQGGADPAMRESFTVAEESGDTALFEARRVKLQAVLDHMAVVLRERFMEWGVVGVAGDGTIESPGSAHGVGESRSVSRGTAFTIDGRTWEILQVETGFTFHPGSFALRSMANREIAGSMLKIGDGPYLPEGERPHVLLMRVMIDEGPEATEIWADGDTTILTQLTWALHMHATLEQLGELAAAMQTFGELMIDAAELFPGGGQAVAAARLLTTAMSVIDGELPAMVAHLVTNPRELLDAVWRRVDGLLSVESALGFLLFSNTSFDGLIREPRAAGPRALGGSTSRRMRRLLFKLQSLGRSMGRIFVRVHDGVQDRRQQAEHAVQNSPRTVRLIGIVADYYLIVASLADHLPDIADLPGAVSEFQATAQDLPARIDEMIASLGSVELPADILPRAQLVDVLLDVIGHRLGGKYKLGVQILLQLLDFIGARDTVVNAIADVLGRAGLTTENLFPAWNDVIVPGIRDRLQAAQTAIRDSLDTTFAAFGTPLNLAAPQADVRLSGTEFPDSGPDAQPLLASELQAGLRERGGGALAPGRAGELLGRIAADSGEPLPEAALADAQSRFGQDFSHVRLHRDGRADELTRSLGARALTSGSHVVLGDAARGEAAAGGPVLYHELAHVVQQTGPRAPGGPPRPPRPGRARRGVRWDPRDEAEADTAASAALRGRATGLRARGAGAAGWQPNMIELYGQRFLRQLTDVTAIEAEVADIDRSGATTGVRLIGRDVRRAVSHVGENLRTKFRPGAHGLRAATGGPFHGKLDIISNHLLAAHPDIAAAVEDIGIRASYEAERARDGRPARMALNVHDFSRRLERYIFGKTGILLELSAQTRGLGRDAVFQNASAPYQHADVKFVFLANVHGNSRLWTDALAHRTTAGGTQGTAITAAERAELRTQIRPVLRDLGPSSSIWDGSAYRFSHAIFAAAEELTRLQQSAASAGTLPAASLPSRDQYLDTTGSTPTAGFGNQRLHLGTFDQKASGEQSGKERESHHITQYLLVEYFHNGATGSPETDQDRMGFPLLASHADAYGADMHANAAGVPLRYRDVVIDELEQGRGGKMPTLLLARGTHRRGNLHINPRADDFSDAAVGTQAGAVNHIYKNALPAEQRRIEKEVVRGTLPYSAWEDYRRQHDIAAPINDAMQGTYRYMKTFMQTQLRSGLVGIERGYYNDLYAAAHPASTDSPMTTADMNHVADKAIAHNADGDAARGIRGLMSYGWRG